MTDTNENLETKLPTKMQVDLNLTNENIEKKLSLTRRYFMEIAVIVFAIAIVYLFVGYRTLERDMRNYLINDRLLTVQKVAEASDVIKRNTEVIEGLKETLFKNSIILNDIRNNTGTPKDRNNYKD